MAIPAMGVLAYASGHRWSDRRPPITGDNMKHSRRTFVTLSLTLLASAAQAQSPSFPAKPITLIVASAPGGTTDISARMLAEPLGKALGQTIVVDNRAGASGGIAAVAVKRAEPDGHTLLMQYSGYHVITPVVSKHSLGWEAKDLQPVANVLTAPQVVVVRAGLPVKTMAELIAYAKANPGKLTYASSGNGSLQHVTGAMLEHQAGIRMTHVPYKGTGPALQDLLGAQVDLTFGTPPPFMPHIQSGKLRALAVTGKTRVPSLRRCADHRRGRIAQARRHVVVRGVRAGGHAEARGGQAYGRDRQDRRHCRIQGQGGRPRCQRRLHAACATGRLRPGRAEALGRGGQGLEDRVGLIGEDGDD